MRRIAVVTLALMLASCSSESSGATATSEGTTAPVPTVGETTAPGPPDPAAVATTSTTTVAPGSTAPQVATTTTVEPSEDDLAVFIAAMEELLVGTVYEGEAINEPELFLATGWLFCDWLDEGDTPDAALTRYLDELAGEVDAATDDQLVLAGALLGAAVVVLCPWYAGEVG
jgi:hypothetical protein